MRNNLCDENILNNIMEISNEGLLENYKELEVLKEDLMNGFQRYSSPTMNVIESIKSNIVVA